MPFTIHPAPLKDSLIVIGQGSRVLEAPKQKTKAQGVKKMGDRELNDDVIGTKTIRKDDADEKGAIGSHGENAPAQEKVGESKPKEDPNG